MALRLRPTSSRGGPLPPGAETGTKLRTRPVSHGASLECPRGAGCAAEPPRQAGNPAPSQQKRRYRDKTETLDTARAKETLLQPQHGSITARAGDTPPQGGPTRREVRGGRVPGTHLSWRWQLAPQDRTLGRPAHTCLPLEPRLRCRNRTAPPPPPPLPPPHYC